MKLVVEAPMRLHKLILESTYLRIHEQHWDGVRPVSKPIYQTIYFWAYGRATLISRDGKSVWFIGDVYSYATYNYESFYLHLEIDILRKLTSHFLIPWAID